jgi:putative ABC transport system substrate-binding protein
VRRREFIALVGGAVAWPLAARSQQLDRIRRIGVLMYYAESDPQGQSRITAFKQGLQEKGWIEGGKVRIDYRWAAADADRIRIYAAELVELAPDVILASAPAVLRALQHQTSTVPIVFVSVADPVGAGFVASLAKPGGNITGFTNFEFSLAGKWLELLKQIAPHITRVAVIQNPTNPTAAGYLRVIDAAAPALGLQLTTVAVHDAASIERAIDAYARDSSVGLILLPELSMTSYRELIVARAALHRLPAVYPFEFFAAIGGLMSYGPDGLNPYRQASSYVDRILKGEKPGDLPVQAATKFELVINLKTAKALGLTIPPTLLARADEVIE